jgi:hypothetical protein
MRKLRLLFKNVVRDRGHNSSSADITVITAIMGDYDEIPPIPDGFTHAVLVSDVPIQSEWTNFVMKTDLPPRLAGKIPKFRPDLFVKTSSSVWVDASLRDPNKWLFVACREKLQNYDLVLFQHPDRDSIVTEVAASRDSPKYDSYPLEEQVSFYLKSGFKDDVGLFACGVIARNHSREVLDFGNEWLMENMRWSIQDQLSFSFLLAKRGLALGKFDEHLWDGPLTWNPHKRPYS